MNDIELLGEYYGYPKCCIKNYVEILSRGLSPEKEFAKTGDPKIRERLQGTGFVPCSLCQAIPLHSPSGALSTIKANRISRNEFPNGWSRYNNKQIKALIKINSKWYGYVQMRKYDK